MCQNPNSSWCQVLKHSTCILKLFNFYHSMPVCKVAKPNMLVFAKKCSKPLVKLDEVGLSCILCCRGWNNRANENFCAIKLFRYLRNSSEQADQILHFFEQFSSLCYWIIYFTTELFIPKYECPEYIHNLYFLLSLSKHYGRYQKIWTIEYVHRHFNFN